MIARIDADYGVFDGRTFKAAKFAAWLERTGIPVAAAGKRRAGPERRCVPRTGKVAPGSGAAARVAQRLSELRLNDLAVGRDGRNRCLLSAFQARTGPQPAEQLKIHIWAQRLACADLIKPPPGYGVAYIDWSPTGIRYCRGPVGRRQHAGRLPVWRSVLGVRQAGRRCAAGRNQEVALAQRDQFKACVLAVQYGMGPDALAARIGQPPVVARDLLRTHQETYRDFWRWSDAAVDHAMPKGALHTVFGWTVHVGADCKKPDRNQ